MSYPALYRKAALREVVEAVRIMGGGRGSSLADIYFVMDNLHGRKDKAKIRHAVKAAVIEGLLKQQHTRYKVKSSLQSHSSCVNASARGAPFTHKHKMSKRTCTTKSCFEQPRKVSNVKKTKSFTSCSCCSYDSVSSTESRQDQHVHEMPKRRGSVKYPLYKIKMKIDHKSSKGINNKNGQVIVKNKARTENIASVNHAYSGKSIKKQSKKGTRQSRSSISDEFLKKCSCFTKSKSQASRKKQSKKKSSVIASTIKSNQKTKCIKLENKSNDSKDSKRKSSNCDHMYSNLRIV